MKIFQRCFLRLQFSAPCVRQKYVQQQFRRNINLRNLFNIFFLNNNFRFFLHFPHDAIFKRFPCLNITADAVPFLIAGCVFNQR